MMGCGITLHLLHWYSLCAKLTIAVFTAQLIHWTVAPYVVFNTKEINFGR